MVVRKVVPLEGLSSKGFALSQSVLASPFWVNNAALVCEMMMVFEGDVEQVKMLKEWRRRRYVTVPQL